MLKKVPQINSSFLGLIPPLVYILSVLFFDRLEPFRTVTPPLLMTGLLIFSLLIKPWWVVFWAIIYTTTASLILLNPKLYAFFSNGFQDTEVTSHQFRVFGLIATATFACVFSGILNRLRAQKEVLDQLLLHMPLPVLVSDSVGDILLVNEKARKFFGLTRTQYDKGMFFNLLAPLKHQGKCISAYLNIFSERCSDGAIMKLEFAGKPVNAHFEFMNTTPPKLVTIIQYEV